MYKRQAIYYGQQGEAVSLLQYLLSILSEFYLTIPLLTIDGIFGDETLAAVKALQQDAGLAQTLSLIHILPSVC